MKNSDKKNRIDKLVKNLGIDLPIYSYLILLNSELAEDTNDKEGINTEGWIFTEEEIPQKLQDLVRKKVANGILHGKDHELILKEATKLKVSREAIAQFVQIKLKIAEEEAEGKRKRSQKSILAFGVVGIFIVALLIAYFGFYKPYQYDKSLERRYVIANNLNLRHNTNTSSKSNILTLVPYGTEVKIIETFKEDELTWAKVKVDLAKNGETIEYEGYLGGYDKYMSDKKFYYEVDGIYGNPEARKLVLETEVKKALVGYLNQIGARGKMNEARQVEIYGKVNDSPEFQVFGIDKDLKFTIIGSGKFLGNTENCTAVILTNLKSQERTLEIFKFDKNDNWTHIYQTPFPSEYDGVRRLSKNKWVYIKTEKGSKRITTKTYSLVYGVNDSFSILKQKILMYNGTTFKLFDLTKNAISL